MILRVQLVPEPGFHLFAALTKREIEIAKSGRGTFYRRGRKTRDRRKWAHKSYGGWIRLERSAGEVVVAEVHESKGSDSWQLLQAFVGFAVRHCADHIESIHIQIPRAG